MPRLHIFNQHTDEAILEILAPLDLSQQEHWVYYQHIQYSRLCLPTVDAYLARRKTTTPFADELRAIHQTFARTHWFPRPPVSHVLQQVRALLLQQQIEKERTLIVNKKPYTVLKKCSLLAPINNFEEQEENSTAWVVSTPLGPQLVISKNDTPYFAQPEQLASKIEQYQQALTSAQELLQLLNS